MKRFFTFCIVVLFATSIFIKAAVNIDTAIVVNKVKHKLLLSIPNDYNKAKKYPLVIGLHYCGGTSQEFRTAIKLVTDSLKIIVACPDNSSNELAVNDSNMITIAIDSARSLYNIDTTKVYLTGMSCNSDYILQHALNKLYPFKGIFPWAPYTSGINPKYYNLNTKIPILLSIGTEDPNYVIILALYDSLKFHKANVNLIIEQGIGHTLAFADFGKMMVKSIYYLNDTNTISLSSQADIAMMSNESKDIVIKYKNKSTHKIKFKIQSSNPSKVPNPKITSQKGDSIVLNISPAITIYGKFSIVIEATDSLGTSIEQITFHVNVTKFVDVKNVNNNYLFEIYPNPASDLLNVRNIEAGSILQIFDITGNEILSKVLNSSIEVLNVTNFSKGIYMMKVTGKNSNETKKLVVK